MIIQTDLKWAYSPSRFTKAVKYLVLHHAAGNGSVEAIHAYHRDTNGWAGIAYHLYVRKDGKVYAGRPMDCQGGHCLNYNGVSIGICFEGNFETETMSTQQMAGGAEAISYAMSYYPGMKIVGHKELVSTDCPGKCFPLEYFKGCVADGEGVEVDYYGKVTASALNCRAAPNGTILSSYPNGAVVHISREKGGWGLTPDGWVSLQYIKKTDPPEETKEDNMDVKRFKELWTEMRKELQDNDSSQWSEEARKWAVNNGIVQGVGDGNYTWEDILTREQMVTMLYRFAQMMEGGKAK